MILIEIVSKNANKWARDKIRGPRITHTHRSRIYNDNPPSKKSLRLMHWQERTCRIYLRSYDGATSGVNKVTRESSANAIHWRRNWNRQTHHVRNSVPVKTSRGQWNSSEAYSAIKDDTAQVLHSNVNNLEAISVRTGKKVNRAWVEEKGRVKECANYQTVRLGVRSRRREN